ncbi:ABC transporter ATP-binding protein [Heyndrickxia oleronia]|jgi:putative ABC transport system ATP-binding protein|uniref:Phosphate ABC transporter ATP-binding protein n=1 Tax=Heyndrickxia oleronia TaxID=38875 RepID=A0A8E2LE20_9BACI|nr:phosphate ABC transporter ATP-binding protein [Heyndrickxia oleronia]OJH18340.1 phosphate ABC transporter ATP-binding protein [Bacillus obstructivus]MCI1590005.1 phosphate ABC transporter ATP-binding protein [Heyndrickxia oleronia]MCI1613369.1 phosphate ABC transporter ATP-binding protein [Heyndrickxia oleronia]MCI1744723.1 phosphate ABC transporter ATP-binding protein [Heyndrickxia oleronia]MCI1761318.1 phosphate ABC transporter ATP-binding protein [Heyndrickxia oleronia]
MEELEFIHVSKEFKNKNETIQVLKGINGKIQKGTITTIIGPSGSGKSTILSLCNLLSTPTEGEIFIRGKEIREWDVQKLRCYVGIAFQSAPLIKGSALDNLILPAKLHGRTLEQPKKYMEYVGLSEDLLDRPAKELSGGQRQRLSLARTLVNDPSILLLDEVTSALDSISSHEVEELIKKLNHEHGTTILWVTHDLDQAKRVGDHTWLVLDGKLIEAGPTNELFEAPRERQTQQFLELKRNMR